MVYGAKSFKSTKQGIDEQSEYVLVNWKS